MSVLAATAIVLAGAAAVSCGVGSDFKRKVTELRSVKQVSKLEDLGKLLNNASTVMVGVSARIGTDTPIKCEYSGLQAVILEIRKERHIMKRYYYDVKESESNDQKESKHSEQKEYWIRQSELVSEERKEVPWYLHDGTGRLRVELGWHVLPLKYGGRKFKKSKQYCPCEEEKLGVKTLGTEKTEQLVEIGTPLTVVGEAYKDSKGNFFIRKPKGEGPFYFNRGTVSKLIEEYQESSRAAQDISMALFVVAGLLTLGAACEGLLAFFR